jgi:hypothetical protein
MTTNIVLVNLNENKLIELLKFCEKEKIKYTFDKDYYSSESFDVVKLLNNIVKKYLENKVPISKELKVLIDNEYLQYLDETDNELELLDNIEYV